MGRRTRDYGLGVFGPSTGSGARPAVLQSRVPCPKKQNNMKKTIIYLHGYGSSGLSNTVSYLRKLMPDCEVIAPDIPVDPKEALPFFEIAL